MSAIAECKPEAGKPILAPPLDLGERSSYGLFELMVRRVEQPELAREACSELYRRFSARLLASARKWEYFLGSLYDAEVMVDESFLRVLRSAGTFDRVPQAGPEEEDVKVLIWIFRILKNLILEFRDKMGSRRDALYPAHQNEILYRTRVPAAWKIYVREFMNNISAQDSDILTTSYKYYSFDHKQCDIPPDIRVALFREHNITEENLRVRRYRLVDKLKCFIESRKNPPSATTL